MRIQIKPEGSAGMRHPISIANPTIVVDAAVA